MPTSLYLTSAFYMTLLIDMSCIEYVEGDKRAMHGQLYGWCIDEPIQAQERLVVNLLVSDLLTIAKLGHFDGRHDQRLRKEIGCYPGMSHGGILSPFTSILRSNLTVLATFEGIDAMLG